MTKIKQTKDDLIKYLDEQLEMLILLSDAYDQGKTIAAKQIATIIRILLHDTEKSHSLLSQLELKSSSFFDSCTPIENETGSTGLVRSGSYAGLVGVSVGSSTGYIPYLDDGPGNCFGNVSFDEFWNRVVLIDGGNESFTREYIITKVANQDGGAHVGPEIDKKYASLVRNNSMGWKVNLNNSEPKDLKGVELATVRQIGHELIRTLKPDYPKRKMVITGTSMIIGGMGVLIGMAKKMVPFRRIPKVGRNEKCPCESGLKYKRCHGK